MIRKTSLNRNEMHSAIAIPYLHFPLIFFSSSKFSSVLLLRVSESSLNPRCPSQSSCLRDTHWFGLCSPASGLSREHGDPDCEISTGQETQIHSMEQEELEHCPKLFQNTAIIMCTPIIDCLICFTWYTLSSGQSHCLVETEIKRVFFYLQDTSNPNTSWQSTGTSKMSNSPLVMLVLCKDLWYILQSTISLPKRTFLEWILPLSPLVKRLECTMLKLHGRVGSTGAVWGLCFTSPRCTLSSNSDTVRLGIATRLSISARRSCWSWSLSLWINTPHVCYIFYWKKSLTWSLF